ncbi:MAG: hypothetical protein HYX82_04280 [Chloroflexi bacterium]|nr:hypothetical protein [Chloroflexota bacterium]
MKTLVRRGGQWAESGSYVGLTTGEFVSIPKGGGVLPGKPEAPYLSTPLAAIAAPFLGLLYVIFVPFIAIVLVAQLIVLRVGRALKAASLGILQAIIPSWRPGEAYLARGGRRKKKEEKLTALEHEVESRKKQES